MKTDEIMRKLPDVCRLKRLSYATGKSYAGWVQSYSRVLLTLPAEWTSEEKGGAFLTRIAKRGVAAAAQSDALNALVFLYGQVIGTPQGNVEALRVRRPPTVRTALTARCGREFFQPVPCAVRGGMDSPTEVSAP